MSLSVIGAGFGRTGTMSLKFALESIGINKCHHMIDVIQNADQASAWREVAFGKVAHWDNLFQGYLGAVDWPACYYWDTLINYYPQAKTILTVRDSESWYNSLMNTIYKSLTTDDKSNSALPQFQKDMARKLILEDTFKGRIEDKQFATAIFEEHNKKVIEAIPADRILVFKINEGWKPLCNFLGVKIPDKPFPKTNTTEEFTQRFAD